MLRKALASRSAVMDSDDDMTQSSLTKHMMSELTSSMRGLCTVSFIDHRYVLLGLYGFTDKQLALHVTSLCRLCSVIEKESVDKELWYWTHAFKKVASDIAKCVAQYIASEYEKVPFCPSCLPVD